MSFAASNESILFSLQTRKREIQQDIAIIQKNINEVLRETLSKPISATVRAGTENRIIVAETEIGRKRAEINQVDLQLDQIRMNIQDIVSLTREPVLIAQSVAQPGVTQAEQIAQNVQVSLQPILNSLPFPKNEQGETSLLLPAIIVGAILFLI